MDKDVPDRTIDLDELTKPFPKAALKQRKADGQSGKMLTYVEGHTVIHRLNAATKNNWNFEVREIDSTAVGKDKNGNDRLLWKVRGALTIPTLGTRENIGVQVASLGTGEDLIKGAITDCIKKCATLFGVGIELYGPDYEDGELDDHRQSEPAPIRRASQPGAEQAASGESPRDGAARTLWNEAQALGLTKPMLNQFCIDRTNHTLEKADTQMLIKVRNDLKAVKDVPALIDVLTNRPAVAAETAASQGTADAEEDSQPCAIDGCKGRCIGSWVDFSLRRYGVVLCSKHSAMAKRGEIDAELERLNHAL